MSGRDLEQGGCFDAIVVGAGSVGLPTAYYLAAEGWDVLVLDRHASAGQGQHKAAIGGVRATHSDPVKRLLCAESLRIFAGWEANTGTDIGWKKGGYCFPAYREDEESMLRDLFPPSFRKYHLDIGWVGAEKIREVVPGISPQGLRGGIWSPDDGQVSPLLYATSITEACERAGVRFRFDEEVVRVLVEEGAVCGVETDTGRYDAPVVVNAAGARARSLALSTGVEGVDIPVQPDSHEAGISAPVAPFLDPLVVDMRPGLDGLSKNFYFGQVAEGAVIFCYTPSRLIPGEARESTAGFMPSIARRLVRVLPRLRDLSIRRVWRGLYPMTPDGKPILGRSKLIDGLYHAAGMCGQGFMLGPGVGRNLAHLIVHGEPIIDRAVFDTLSPDRDYYAATERLK